jgi:hypothetical protein
MNEEAGMKFLLSFFFFKSQTLKRFAAMEKQYCFAYYRYFGFGKYNYFSLKCYLCYRVIGFKIVLNELIN